MKTRRHTFTLSALAAITLAAATALPALATPPVESKPPADSKPPVESKAVAAAAGADTPGSAAEALRLATTAPKAEDYPNASKATLLDLSDITVLKDGTNSNLTRETVKLFSDRDRDTIGEIRIPYTQGEETVKVLWAHTIRADGTIIAVKPDEIHDLGYGDGETYADARVKAFSMPGLEPGAIVDYEYVMEDKNPYIPGAFWTQWWFGGLEPRMLSRLTITAPKGLTIHQDPRNIPAEDSRTGSMTRTQKDLPGDRVLYTYEMRKIEPLQLEPLMPQPIRMMPQITLSTLGDWQQIASTYWNLAKDRQVATPELKQIVADLTKGKTTQEEKAKAIYYYVEEKTRYVAKELGIGAIQPRPAQQTCDYRYGDCKDMATLLVAMLHEAGIKAAPVLLHAESKEAIRNDLPGMDAFDHVICLSEIDGKEFWLDATAQICPWGEIPGGDRGADAFVIRDGVGSFETIPPYSPDDNRQSLTAKLALQADGSANGKVTISSNGDMNMGLRSAFLNLPPDKHKQLLEGLARGIAPNAQIGEYQISDYKDKDVPVTVSFDVTFPSWAKKSGDLLVFAARPEQVDGRVSSPFGQDTIRSLPITQELSSRGDSKLELTLPPDYTLLSQPSEATVKSDLGEYDRHVSMAGDLLTIAIAGIDFRASVAASHYDEVRAYYDNYLKASEESVIVKKK